jgi:aminoglycoside 6'-N-acetyltransferase
MAVRFSFAPVTAADFPLLGTWLSDPGVRRWWCHDPSPEGVERDFGPAVRGEEPCEDLLALLDGRPVGLVQRARYDDYPEDRDELARYVEVPAEAVMVDYLVGAADDRGRGLGPRMIREVAAATFAAYERAPAILVAVVAANVASWRALEKAGFHRVGEGEIEPDNPVDEPLHYLYRLDRP